MRKTRYNIDELMRGMKITISFSCPSRLLQAIEEYRSEERLNTSQAITKLIRLGMTYRKVLSEQEVFKQSKLVVKPKKKKPKPKTPSKKK